MQNFFNYDHATFDYDPFPVALVRPIMEHGLYQEFVDSFPAVDRMVSFAAMGKEGSKFTLSEKESPQAYAEFVKASPLWRDFHRWIKSDDFCYGTLAMLQKHDIDLGFRRLTPWKRLQKRLRTTFTGTISPRELPLKARFEFSALPAHGGAVVPHTDAPSKIVTMVISMVKEGEWDPAIGGGTEMCRPRRTSLAYNQMNALAGFDDMEAIRTYEFTPNQAVIFIKTFNSWHAVRPMTGTDPKALRRTLTIVIEARG